MNAVLRILLLLCVSSASLVSGLDGAVLRRAAGADVDCGMECCDETVEVSCCDAEAPRVEFVSPCGCKEGGHEAILELNSVDWAPDLGDPHDGERLEAPVAQGDHAAPLSRRAAPEVAPPRA